MRNTGNWVFDCLLACLLDCLLLLFNNRIWLTWKYRRTNLALSQQRSTGLCHLCAGIKNMRHHTQSLTSVVFNLSIRKRERHTGFMLYHYWVACCNVCPRFGHLWLSPAPGLLRKIPGMVSLRIISSGTDLDSFPLPTSPPPGSIPLLLSKDCLGQVCFNLF